MTAQRKERMALALALKGLKLYAEGCEHDGAMLDRVMRGQEQPEGGPCHGCQAKLVLYRIGVLRRTPVVTLQ